MHLHYSITPFLYASLYSVGRDVIGTKCVDRVMQPLLHYVSQLVCMCTTLLISHKASTCIFIFTLGRNTKYTYQYLYYYISTIKSCICIKAKASYCREAPYLRVGLVSIQDRLLFEKSLYATYQYCMQLCHSYSSCCSH